MVEVCRSELHSRYKNPIGLGVFWYMVGYSVYGYMIYIEVFSLQK